MLFVFISGLPKNQLRKIFIDTIKMKTLKTRIMKLSESFRLFFDENIELKTAMAILSGAAAASAISIIYIVNNFIKAML